MKQAATKAKLCIMMNKELGIPVLPSEKEWRCLENTLSATPAPLRLRSELQPVHRTFDHWPLGKLVCSQRGQAVAIQF